MKPSKDKIRNVVLASLADEDVELPDSVKDFGELHLIGERALLKSVALVSMLVGVEQRLSEECGVEISLMDERALSQTRSPFRSVDTLVGYIEHLMKQL